MYVLCSEEEINVLEIDLIVITNFKEEQDSGGKFGRIAKQLRRGSRRRGNVC